MSKFVPADIQCPCGETYRVQVAESIHAPRVPEIRQQILDGSFHRFTCPHCQQRSSVDKLFIYLDFDAHHWLTVFPEADLARRSYYQKLDEDSFRRTMLERAPDLVKRWAPSFTRRVVCGRAGLREKLIVFESGLDDRMIELMKLDLIRGRRLTLSPDTRCSLIECRDRVLKFHYAASPSEAPRALSVPWSEYGRMVAGIESYQPALDQLMAGSFVDFRALLSRELRASASAAESTPSR